MSNPAKRPEPHRVPPAPESEREPELTAQPRQLSDELGARDGGQAGLSVDADDLGVRFLSEATEQGEALTHGLMESELSLVAGPDSDEVLTPPNFAYENTLWEQTVGLMTQTQGATDQLRAPSTLEDESDPSEQESDDLPFRTTESDIREISLFDREGATGDETIAPRIENEDAGRHAQTSRNHELGVQVEGSPEPAREKSAAVSGKHPRALMHRTARAALRGVARGLRRLAGR
jgi:hypothetical protein